jgi:hypothetical protein
MSDAQLAEWLKQDLQHVEHSPSDEALIELVEDTRRTITLYLESPKKLRPAAAAGELNRLAKGLETAVRAAETVGKQGLLMVIAMSEANQDDLDPNRHILYLQRMASLSRKAAEAAQQLSLSAQDNRGGRTPTQELRAIVATLMLSYQEILGIWPSHTVDKIIHLAERGFTGFVKEALRLYAPEGIVFEPRLIDKVVREKLVIRDLEFFDPPPLP